MINNFKPFLKWAGGKTQLLNEINENMPKDIEKYRVYVEPFVGAGSVFFDVISKNLFDKYIINDINSKLINLYLVIRDNPEIFIEKLEEEKGKYLNSTDKEKELLFYSIRDEFNNDNQDEIIQAVRFVFLNKTAFNGLYRENLKGKFNVPWGKYKNPSFYDKDNILAVSKVLNMKNEKDERIIEIVNGQFCELVDKIDENTFVYMDPPYRPVTKGGFTSYNKSSFNDEDQIKLRDFFESLDKKGARLMLSNSDPKNLDEDDEFFDKLYEKFNIQRVYAKRSINSKGSKRGEISEILVTNYS